MRKLIAVICICAVAFSTGCSKRSTSRQVLNATSMDLMVSEYSSTRFIAERHKLDVVSTEAQLPVAWQAVIGYCGTLRCEIVTSSITTKTRGSVPTGNVTLRVLPEDVKKLLAEVQRQSTVMRHTTESEDKTAAVVDAEAKIKNLMTFRDNLRAMLAKASTTVKDSVEIQQQLTDVQSRLDSETVQRKILANETEKVTVEITFLVETLQGSGKGFAEIASALRESGDVLADSVASLITVIVAVIPWLVLIVPLCWMPARYWGRWRRRRASNVAAAASGT